MPRPDDCPHRPPCPGCPRFGAPELPDGIVARLSRLARTAGLPEPIIHRAPALGHRHRARLAVRGRSGNPKIGLFQAGTHRIVHVPRCPVHHPRINEAAAEIREAIRETGIPPYADRPHRGILRYLQLVVERSSGRVQVVLVGRGEDPGILGTLPAAIKRRLGNRLQGLFFNAQPDRTNAILGPTTIHLAGAEATREDIAGVPVFFPPGAFGQNHLPLFERAVERIGDLVPSDAVTTELHAGVGSIGLSLLAGARAIRFNERSPDGLRGLEMALAIRPSEHRAHASIHPGPAEENLELLDDTEILVVDPPRRGLGDVLLQALATKPPARLIYLACGQDSLQSDLEELSRSGRFLLRGLEIFDFFPFTNHVETLVWLDRQ